ncbi:hypothetical protein [Streptomyces sp. SS8]
MEPDQDITATREPLPPGLPAGYVLRHALATPLPLLALIAAALGVVSLMKITPYPWAALVYGFTVVLVSSWVRRGARKRWSAGTGNPATRGQ